MTATLGPDYWRSQSLDAPAALQLPTDGPRSSNRRGLDAHVPIAFSREILEAVTTEARHAETPAAAVMLSLFAELLSRHTGQDDLVVQTALGDVPLPQRIQRRPDDRLCDLASRVYADSREASCVGEMTTSADVPRSSESQVLFAWNPASVPASAFDLGLVVFADESRFDGELHFDPTLFDASTVERWGARFLHLLESAVARPERKLDELPSMSDVERAVILRTFNLTAYPFDESPVHVGFGLRAKGTPTAPAIIGTDGTTLTYAEVAARSSVLARCLNELSVGRGSRVGLWLPRSPMGVVASLAVLRSGGAYVPLEVKDPPSRIQQILADADVSLLITERAVVRDTQVSVPVLFLDDPEVASELANGDGSDCTDSEIDGSDAAYVIYTSGTTGSPNGVVVEHRSLANLVAEHVRLVGMTRRDRVSQMGSAAFDASMCEVWSTLTTGACMHIVDDEVRLDPSRFLAWLTENSITVSGMPTVLAESLLDLDASMSKLRWVTTGGATLRRRPRAGSPFRLLNSYGPTETTVYVTAEDVGAGDAPVRTIGRPIRNTAIYILGPSGEPTPIGVYGEIHVGGVNVSRGYLQRPELTGARFVPDPFADTPGARMYKTGDVGRWLADGRIEFAGRSDHQVKVRGFRVELGEVEAALVSIPEVEDAVVMAREDTPGDIRLVGYVVMSSATASTTDDLRSELRSKLPDHMIPSALVALGELPTTSSGKVDRKSLPPPGSGPPSRPFVSPRTPTEEVLAELWSRILGVPRVGATDDFFELGGHSLVAATLVSAISNRLGVHLAVADLYDGSTVEKLAVIAEGATSELAPPRIERATRSREIVTSYFQDALLAFESGRAPSPTWTEGARMTLRGRLDIQALREAICATLERFDVLRETFDLAAPETGRARLCTARDIPFEHVVARKASSKDVDGLCAQRVNAAFVLDGSPLLRFTLVELADEEHVLVAAFHSIIQDPMRPDLLMFAVAEDYAALRSASPIAAPALRYSDYAAWERAWFEDAGHGHVHAARRRIEGAKPLDLAKRPRGPRGCTVAHDVFLSLSDTFAAGFFELCRTSHVTHFMALTGLVSGALASVAGVDEVCLASPVNLRPVRPELEPMLGRFLNWVPLRIPAPRTPSRLERMELGREAVLAGMSNEVAPAALVYGGNDVFDDPLCRVLFHTPITGATSREPPLRRIGDLEVDCRVIVPRSGPRSDLAITFVTTETTVRGRIRGQADLFEARDVEELAAELKAQIESQIVMDLC